MKNVEDSYFAIGEMAEKFGISVRTLQHYDRMGLLKSTYSEGGRRMYTRDDILKLQQILFLKSFDFSLFEIKNMLLNKEAPPELEQVFEQQRGILLAQISNYNQMVDTLNAVIAEIKAGGGLSVGKLMIMIEQMKQGNPYRFMIRYFGEDQLKDLSERFNSKQEYDQFMETVKNQIVTVNSLERKGADPAGEEGQKMAADWWKMVMTFTNGNQKLIETLISGGMDMKNWPSEADPMKNTLNHFLSKALSTYLKNVISFPEKEANEK
jgi:DNA-binding transcriptional MerR regulator